MGLLFGQPWWTHLDKGYKFHTSMSEKYNLNMAWKRPVSRMYEFNSQRGENYYTHLTTYIDQKSATGIKPDIPGALTMSERLAYHPIHGRTSVKTVTSSNSYFSHSAVRTFVA